MNEKTTQSKTETDKILFSGKLYKAHLYIESRYKDLQREREQNSFHPCITISREAGAGVNSVCEHLLKYIEENKIFPSQQWAAFDHNLIEEVLRHHHLPQRLAELMSEDRYSHIKSFIIELLSKQPTKWSLVHKTSETILQLAEVGNSIIVGRGGSIITANLDNTLHIRLIANLNDRIRRIQNILDVPRDKAENYIMKKDSDRNQYIKTYFNKDITDPHYYHLIINTSIVPNKTAGEMIGHLIEVYFKKYITQPLK
ncbi:MAG TPA: cytidylate kinase-like family protein [Ignavibacteria bacterium]|nr:cytidylate kinase-like family protein [Ignavibacteria bacterium]